MLTVGSDPEIFLKTYAGDLVTSIGRLGGTKSRPRLTQHGAIQEDGVAAELNPVPSSSLSEFLLNHRLVLNDLQDILTPLELEVEIVPSAYFKDSLLDSYQARVAGCEKDYNAWKKSENPVVNLEDTNVRACGGHLHIGYDRAEKDILSRLEFVKALDFELGVPSVILDSCPNRRELYGKAGAHRPKFAKKDGYNGVEYRVLSNFWLKSDDLMEFVYSKIEKVHNNLDFIAKKASLLEDEIVSIINTGDQVAALAFCKKYEVSYV